MNRLLTTFATLLTLCVPAHMALAQTSTQTSSKTGVNMAGRPTGATTQPVIIPPRQTGQETLYLTTMPDVPVMPGMVELLDGGFVFDAPDGQIARATTYMADEKARNPVSGDVLEYYTKALPELGWKAQKSGIFVRNGEQLTVTIDKVASGLLVTYDLNPRTD